MPLGRWHSMNDSPAWRSSGRATERLSLWSLYGWCASSSSSALASDLRASSPITISRPGPAAFAASFVDPYRPTSRTLKNSLDDAATVERHRYPTMAPMDLRDPADPHSASVSPAPAFSSWVSRTELAAFEAICLVDAGVQSACAVRSAEAAGQLRAAFQRYPRTRHPAARHG